MIKPWDANAREGGLYGRSVNGVCPIDCDIESVLEVPASRRDSEYVSFRLNRMPGCLVDVDVSSSIVPLQEAAMYRYPGNRSRGLMISAAGPDRDVVNRAVGEIMEKLDVTLPNPIQGIDHMTEAGELRTLMRRNARGMIEEYRRLAGSA